MSTYVSTIAPKPANWVPAYQQSIRECLRGRVYDPRHVEAFMRCEHPTLDALSKQQFRAEVEKAVECIEAGGCEFAETVAKSFGL